ncbi:MAG TPA: M20/M25/M40 family metallo-hydrolase [Rhizomicrobium sp.]|nr:M20/M25/M40 family metallo-hydrolase [Rhizomicrobium sp.]
MAKAPVELLPRGPRGRAVAIDGSIALFQLRAMGTGRIWLLGVSALGIWFLSVHGSGRPAVRPADAPATEFSAVRADAILARLLGPELPRSSGSPEAAAFRARLQAELAQLGIPHQAITQESCRSRRNGQRVCLPVTNIRAVLVPGENPEVLLMAHTDSVPRGPGAADDASGVATILETMRALKARGLAGRRPIAALFTDGEERGLFGAYAYAGDAVNRARTGVVVNVEARGNQGPSLLFQTHVGDAPLIDLYARAAPHPATSSLYAEIYKILPNNTDLTPFLEAGIAGANFAFIGNARQYHTLQDRRESISPVTLQHHGENVLALTDALSRTDPATLKGGGAIYLDILGRWLPRLPASWALPLSVLAFVGIAVAGWYTPRERRLPQLPVLAALTPLFLLLLCVGVGFGLHMLAGLIGGSANPSLENPLWLRLALAFGVWAAALLTARWAGAIACWLWFAGLAVGSAIFLPGLTPYFLFPALVAAPLLLLTIRSGRGTALFVSALTALVIWLGFNGGSEAIMGLAMHPIFTVTAGFALLSLLPLMAGRRLGGSALASLAVALAFAVVAGFQVN